MDSVTQEEMKEMFDMLDTDSNGSLKLEELSNGIRALGLNPSEAELEGLFRSADVNSDGRLAFEEFCRLYSECERNNTVTYDRLMEELSQYDKNNDGTISKEELRDVLGRGGEALSDAQIEEIIEDFDVSKDGVLNLEELVSGLLRKG